jgi:hypothetical protein
VFVDCDEAISVFLTTLLNFGDVQNFGVRVPINELIALIISRHGDLVNGGMMLPLIAVIIAFENHW